MIEVQFVFVISLRSLMFLLYSVPVVKVSQYCTSVAEEGNSSTDPKLVLKSTSSVQTLEMLA